MYDSFVFFVGNSHYIQCVKSKKWCLSEREGEREFLCVYSVKSFIKIILMLVIMSDKTNIRNGIYASIEWKVIFNSHIEYIPCHRYSRPIFICYTHYTYSILFPISISIHVYTLDVCVLAHTHTSRMPHCHTRIPISIFIIFDANKKNIERE